MRYEIHAIQRSKKENQDPNKLVYKIWDNTLQQYGLSYYLTMAAAETQLAIKLVDKNK